MIRFLKTITRVFDKKNKPESVKKREWMEFCTLLEKVGVGVASLAGLGFITQIIVHVGAINWKCVVNSGFFGFYDWPEQARITAVAFVYVMVGLALILISHRLKKRR